MFFYKNILYTLPQVIYGYFSYFSGTSLFDDWYLVMYNLLFTTVQVAYLGICDIDVTYWKIKESDYMAHIYNFIKTCGKKDKKKKSATLSRAQEINRLVASEERTLNEDSSDTKKTDSPIDESFINCEHLEVHKLIKSKFQHLYYIS